MDRRNSNSDVQTNNPRRGFSVYRDVFWAWAKQSHDYPENDRGYKRNRHYKYIPAIIALFFVTPSYAETVGGVSATAAPVANSSGSVTNQAIQVLQGPYITNTYGGGIQCQGPTRNFTPYVTGTNVSHNYNDGGSLLIEKTEGGNFTLSITNVPTTKGVYTVSVIMKDAGSRGVPSSLNVNGTGQTIYWAGGGAPNMDEDICVVTFAIVAHNMGTTNNFHVLGTGSTFS